MKKILIILITFISFSCKAQQPVIPLEDLGTDFANGTYLKDVNNDLDKFVGTWIMTTPISKLTIKLRKIEQYNRGSYFLDVLVGEYKYELNGSTVVNTLPNFLDLSIEPYNHCIVGSRIIYKGQYPACSTCSITENRVSLFFTDPDELTRGYLNPGGIALRHKIENGIEKMEAKIFIDGPVFMPENAPSNFQLPTGEYTLTKQ